MTGIAGSSNIGDGVMTGGQVGIKYIRIGDNVKIAAKSAVFSDVAKGQSIMGNPAINKFKFIKIQKLMNNKISKDEIKKLIPHREPFSM